MNVGKRFEEDFSHSIKSDWFCHRLKDTAQSYNNSKDTKFSWDNPFDYMLFNGDTLYCLELKSTCKKYMGFQTNKDDESSKIIKWHQIESLTKASEYKNIVAGFLLNFRLDNNEQITYFFNIKDFNKMIKNINKKSFNIVDAVLNGAVKVNGVKKRVRYTWEICSLLEQYNNIDKNMNE
jgi:hypothetical protein